MALIETQTGSDTAVIRATDSRLTINSHLMVIPHAYFSLFAVFVGLTLNPQGAELKGFASSIIPVVKVI